MHLSFSDNRRMCDQTLITCEHNVANITCPDSMSIFIINGFYGRTDRDE